MAAIVATGAEVQRLKNFLLPEAPDLSLPAAVSPFFMAAKTAFKLLLQDAYFFFAGDGYLGVIPRIAKRIGTVRIFIKNDNQAIGIFQSLVQFKSRDSGSNGAVLLSARCS